MPARILREADAALTAGRSRVRPEGASARSRAHIRHNLPPAGHDPDPLPPEKSQVDFQAQMPGALARAPSGPDAVVLDDGRRAVVAQGRRKLRLLLCHPEAPSLPERPGRSP